MIRGTIYKGGTVRYGVEKISIRKSAVAMILARQYLQFMRTAWPASCRAAAPLVVEKKDGLWEIVVLQNTRIMDVGAPQKESGAVQK